MYKNENNFLNEKLVGTYVVMAEHDAFGSSGRTTRVDESAALVGSLRFQSLRDQSVVLFLPDFHELFPLKIIKYEINAKSELVRLELKQ